MDHSALDDSTLQNTHINKITRRRKIKNQVIAKIITTCGWLVLLTLGLLLWFLVAQVAPLANDPTLEPVTRYSVPEDQQVLILGDLHQGQPMVTRDAACQLHFYTANLELSQPALQKRRMLPTLCSDQVTLRWISGELYMAKLSALGVVRIEKITLVNHTYTSELQLRFTVTAAHQAQDYGEFNFSLSDDLVLISLRRGDQWQVSAIKRDSKQSLWQQTIEAQHLALLPNVDRIVHVDKQSLVTTHVHSAERQKVELSDAVIVLHAFPGQRSLFISYANQSLQKWSMVNRQGSLQFEPLYHVALSWPLRHALIHSFENAAILISELGDIALLNHVTGQTVSEVDLPLPSSHAYLNNNALYLVTDKSVQLNYINDMQGINTNQSLWGKNQYAGYTQQEFVWQTTSVSDTAEGKYSIVPLVIGSLKASFLALLIAVPLALSAAIYTGYFAPRRLRNWMKPSIELLEAVPSVVLGFIAAIWLAPLAEQFMLAVVLFVLLIPLVLIVFAFIHQPLGQIVPQPFKQGWELPIVAVLLVLDGLFVSVITDGMLTEQGTMAANLITFDMFANINKSTLVVALALGIAIVPSIYSLAEDAIFEVPISLQQASLALGATRLQTLRKTVLVLAYPGILSAITLGLGRAFGETMIVLMITGNTPIADWDLLSGIRTLTANLAIELPESEVSSSHYQILLLTALVLFSFTFVLNTLAEMLRQWLRNNYRHG